MNTKKEINGNNTALLHWFNTLAKMIVKNIRVVFSSFSTAYTNAEVVNIGIDGEVIKKEPTQKGKFLLALGFLFHELGHVLYTPFKSRGDAVAYEDVTKSLQQNGKFPLDVAPSVSYDAKFFYSHRILLSQLYARFSNKVCDGHIEQRLLVDFPHWRKEIMYMRNKWYIEAPTYEELKSKKVDKNTILANLVLNYSLNADAKINSDDALTKDFDKLVPYLDKALAEKNKTARVKAVNDAFVKLISIMNWNKPKEDNNSNKPNNGGDKSDKPQPTQDGEQPENGDIDEPTPISDGEDPKETDDIRDADGQNPKPSNPDEEKDEDNKGSAPSSPSSEDDSDSEDKPENGSDDSDSDSKDSEDNTESSNGGNSSESEDNTDDNSENGGGKPDSSQDESGENENNSNGGSDGNEDKPEGVPMSDDEIEDALNQMLEDIKNEGDDENNPSNVNNMSLNRYMNEADKGEVNNADLDSNSLFDHTTESEFRFGDGKYSYNRDYQAEESAEEIATKMTSDIRRKLRNEKESYQKGLYVGKRLDTKRLYRADKRIMERRKYPDRPNMRVVVLMDVSGSITNALLNREKTVALCVKRTCEKLHSESEIYAFDSRIIPLLTDEKISTINTGGSTEDAHAFSYCLTRMKKAKELKKIIIVTTDGCGDGSEALTPMLKECKSQKIGVIACGLGSQRQNIEASWLSYGAKVLNCDEENLASELCKAIVNAYK